VRRLFTREHLLGSEWYASRLDAKQGVDIELWKRHVHSLEQILDEPRYGDVTKHLNLAERMVRAKDELARVSAEPYRESLIGTLGRQPL